MSKSIKINYLYSLIGTLAGILFPLITFPYASRVMEADGIGQIGFFTSIISYISLFTSLGIPIYAIREIAKVRENPKEVNKTVLEILLLHTSLTVIGYIVVAVLCVTVYKIQLDIPLFLILSLSVFFNTIGCEWFYKGIEDFKYITIRGLIVRLLYVILLFTCVHTKADILIYALLTVLGTVGNNLFNFYRLRKYVDIKLITFRELNVTKHFIPAIRIFALNLIISMYVNMNTVLIGFMKDNSSVGYYEAATKLTNLLLGVTAALQTTMIPRFSYLAQKGSIDEFNYLSQKIMDFVITINLPISLGLMILSPSLINIFCGHTYQPAILTLEIMSPVILLKSLSGIPCFQILYPLGQEKKAILSTFTGMIANFVLCIILIPKYSYNGAAIAIVLAEVVVTITMFVYGRSYIKIEKYSKHYFNCIVGGVLMTICLMIIRLYVQGDWIILFLSPLIGGFLYFLYLFIQKDPMVLSVIGMIKVKLNK